MYNNANWKWIRKSKDKNRTSNNKIQSCHLLSVVALLLFGQRWSKTFLVTGIAPGFYWHGLNFFLEKTDSFQSWQWMGIVMEKLRILNSRFQIHQSGTDLCNERVKLSWELPDVVVFLGFTVQNSGLKHNMKWEYIKLRFSFKGSRYVHSFINHAGVEKLSLLTLALKNLMSVASWKKKA